MLLSMQGITKRFGGLTAVDNVSLEVRQGEIVGLIGPNGAGKTTFFNILTGIYKPDAGTITFEGREIQGLRPFRIAQCGIARTFQNIRLLKEETVLDNVKVGMFHKTDAGLWASILGLRSARNEERMVTEESLRILETVGLAGYEHLLAGNLSYGNQRRVEIARALVSKPKLLLLDEPTAGMNAEEVQEMTDLIKSIREQGTTVVLIEHNVSMVVGLCDRIAVLDHGVKIVDDVPEVIISHPAVIEAYIGKEEGGEVSSGAAH
ncbi:ABC transporter ATP-binding protein [Polycladomyces subterraneus]|uniref:ABC transporter ATP-binding protein n=1 Tax=Polycladomyces subterraneus TaxID=1016997 RepID=A0ABT8IR28_9BACL|nr:ABC transporter ATP-binding protein [Polycladomyces subterraneus]MDN4595227.1 ABC transporter ATP-binding protein [Polycladomyces subterraneus]